MDVSAVLLLLQVTSALKLLQACSVSPSQTQSPCRPGQCGSPRPSTSSQPSLQRTGLTITTSTPRYVKSNRSHLVVLCFIVHSLNTPTTTTWMLVGCAVWPDHSMLCATHNGYAAWGQRTGWREKVQRQRQRGQHAELQRERGELHVDARVAAACRQTPVSGQDFAAHMSAHSMSAHAASCLGMHAAEVRNHGWSMRCASLFKQCTAQ